MLKKSEKILFRASIDAFDLIVLSKQQSRNLRYSILCYIREKQQILTFKKLEQRMFGLFAWTWQKQLIEHQHFCELIFCQLNWRIVAALFLCKELRLKTTTTTSIQKKKLNHSHTNTKTYENSSFCQHVPPQQNSLFKIPVNPCVSFDCRLPRLEIFAMNR